jgi:hypothetical protein
VAGEDPDYLDRVRQLPCCARDLGHPCYGPIAAHHAGRRPGKNLKPHDHTAIPLCWEHHTGAGIHALHGPFKGWVRAEKYEFEDRKIEETWNEIMTEGGAFAIPF